MSHFNYIFVLQKFFRTIVEMTADLIAKWQAFGFTHGRQLNSKL